MATAQQTAFNTTYAPYATQAGTQLGVSPNIVLAQWAFESNYGQSNAAVNQGNLAGINLPGSTTGTNYATYATPQDFTTAYISTLQNPRYASALNTGTDAGAFVSGLHQGGYFTGDPTAYTTGVQTIAATNPAGVNGPVLAGNAMPDYGVGFDPITGQYDAGLSPYASTMSSVDPAVGTLSGGYVSADGSYVPASAIPGVTPQTGASPIVSSTSAGQVTPSATGVPEQSGWPSGLASTIGNWLSTMETSVGKAFTNAFGSMLESVENWVGRGFLILIGLVILALALWRLMDPDGTKTATLLKGAPGEALV